MNGGNDLKKPVLFVTRALPVESGGTIIVIRRLLENLNPEKVFVLGRTPYKPWVLKNDKVLRYKMIEIPTPQVKGFRLWRLLSIIPGFFQGLYAIRKYKIDAIVGVYPDVGSLLLSSLLARASRKPLLAYFCDLYMENQKSRFDQWLSKKLQPWIFRNAIAIGAANEGMKKFYDQKYGVDSLLLPTAINGALPDEYILPKIEQPFIIGYSGSVVRDRLDPMQALVQAIGNNSKFEIRLFTPQKHEFLDSVGLIADNVVVRFCSSHEELMKELKQCHALYLPLTFKTDYNSKEQLATCFGIKSYEYFQSCRPVIVHCPKDYFTATFFTSSNAGIAIESLDQSEIKEKLDGLIQGYQTEASQMVGNALEKAKMFKGPVVGERFSIFINARKS